MYCKLHIKYDKYGRQFKQQHPELVSACAAVLRMLTTTQCPACLLHPPARETRLGQRPGTEVIAHSKHGKVEPINDITWVLTSGLVVVPKLTTSGCQGAEN